MGPGFFLFFQLEEDEGFGGGAPSTGEGKKKEKIYTDIPKDVVKKIAVKVEAFKDTELDKKETMEAIASSIVEEIEEKHVTVKMKEYGIDEEEALLRFRLTIEALLEDDELALILILANI